MLDEDDSTTRTRKPDGWVARVDSKHLFMAYDPRQNPRPWCHVRAASRFSLWVPRSTKGPRWDKREFVVVSKAGELPRLDMDGWWVICSYMRKPIDFEPKGQEFGVLGKDQLSEIRRVLKNFYRTGSS